MATRSRLGGNQQPDKFPERLAPAGLHEGSGRVPLIWVNAPLDLVG
jgi:hypothetical protein